MKQRKILFVLALLCLQAWQGVCAHDIEMANADGVTIYYVWTNNQTELAVSYSYYSDRYSGAVSIPESVTYNGKTYPVTSIGSSAFRDCSGLTSVTIPNSVTSIGEGAFRYCSGLTSVTIPGSVTSIGDEAFLGCSSLTSVTIPNSVTSIGSSAFQDCSGLTSVTIPNSVTSIGSFAFSGCSGLTSVTIPGSVTSIGEDAFYNCSGLTSVTIPNSVTSIEGSAFSGCSGLTSVTIGNSVTSIGNYAFYGCSGLISVTIPNSVTTIGERAFYNTYLKSVTIGSGVLSIGSDAFSYRNNLRSPQKWGVLSIGSDAFSHYSSNSSVEGAKPVKVIWLTNTPPNGYENAEGIVNYVANDLYSLSNKTVYPFLSSMFEVDGVKYVPVSPSERTCDAIDCLYDESTENIRIGETVNYRGIDMAVRQVHPYAFRENSYIKKVDLALKGDVGRYAFSKCSKLQSIVIPDAVTGIGGAAFEDCTSLESATIGSGVSIINSYAFAGCTNLSDLKIGSNVATIDEYAFSRCSSLPKVVIPSKVVKIGNYAFNECTKLKEVIMDDSPTELSLGSNGSDPLFSSCPLDSVYIGRNISYSTSSSYGYSPFYRNTSLRSVTITDKETEISPNEFYGCTNLKNVSIGDGVETIGNWAFSGCSSLDYFSFGSSVKTIGQEAFSDCTAMTRLISHATTPPTCGSQALDDINKWTCTLNVPSGCVSAYQSAAQWKEFFFVSEGEDEPSVNPNPKKCAKPTIGYSNGKLSFHCDTEGVTFRSNITDSDITSYNSNEVQLTVTYHISAYATKSGYEDSETATATLCWIDVEPRTEGIDGITSAKEIKANAVLIQSNNGMITVSGVDDNSNIVVYSAAGQMIASAKCRGNQASIATNLRNGEVAIVRIGDKSVKIVMR